MMSNVCKNCGTRIEVVWCFSKKERLHELSQGIPRRVRQLAELSLLAGASKQLAAVDGPTVDSVHEELGVSLECRL